MFYYKLTQTSFKQMKEFIPMLTDRALRFMNQDEEQVNTRHNPEKTEEKIYCRMSSLTTLRGTASELRAGEAFELLREKS